MKSIFNILNKKIAGVKNKLLNIPAHPHQVAMGYALGIFLAASPLIGLKVFIAIGLTLLFKWSKVASLIGVFHINILTGPPFYGLSFLVGKSVLGSDVSFDLSGPLSLNTMIEILTTNSLVFIILLAGGIVIGLPLAAAAYYFSKSLIRRKSLVKSTAL
ncbi:MAG: hypothetical protein C0591_02605 [Marinilabiliales bacterium]|nr:MAG: hypothetical protein C0591_02605 [Marinilabiliales bacterium]